MTGPTGSSRLKPCKDCPFKKPACSDHCKKPEYLKYQAEQELIRKNRENHRKHHTPIWKHGDRDPRKR